METIRKVLEIISQKSDETNLKVKKLVKSKTNYDYKYGSAVGTQVKNLVQAYHQN